VEPPRVPRERGTLLLLAHAFPPAGVVGAVRPAKFAKYLPRYGWNVAVVTTGAPTYARDASLVGDVAETSVTRTPSLETFGLLRTLTAVRRRGGLPGAVAAAGRYLLDGVAVPDHAAGWMPFAYRAGIGVARRTRARAVLATGNPFSTFVAGHAVAVRTRRPLLLDFRDPWTLQSWFAPGTLNAAFSRWSEARVVRCAAAIIVVNEDMKDAIDRRYGPAVSRRVSVVPNGYDPEELPPWAPEVPARTLTLLHAGSFTRHRPPDPLWRVLDRLPPALRVHLDVVLLGAEGIEVPAAHAGVARILPRMARVEALGRMSRTHVLLVVTGAYASEQTTKVFEYLGVGAPVLVVGPSPCPAAEVVAECGAGALAIGDATDAAARFLADNLLRVQQGQAPAPRYAVPAAYSRAAQAEQLSAILDKVAAAAGVAS
jgi:glycosyltransferase involved in cell wall biosynthesis